MGIAVSKKTFNLKVKEFEEYQEKAKKDVDDLKKLKGNLQDDLSIMIGEIIESFEHSNNFITVSNEMASKLQASASTLNEYASEELKKLDKRIDNALTKISKAEGTLTDEQKEKLKPTLEHIKELNQEVEKSIEQDAKGESTIVNTEGSTGGTEEKKPAFGKRKRRRRFGSLYCPKAIKGAYGRRKPSKTSRKFKKEIKRRRKTTKRRKTVKRRKVTKRRKTVKRKKTTKRRKTVKRKKTVKRRKPVKRSSPNSLSGIFNIINPNSISKILQENPDIMGKINDLRQLKENGGFNPKELVVIAALSTLSDMTVEDASNQFSMLKASGMSTDSIFDQAMGNSTPPAPKKSFMQGLLGGYGRRKKKVKRKRKKVKRKRKKVKKKRKKVKKKVSKKPSAALKRLCKKHKVRLTVKRGKKRVYKSEKVLKKQCKNKIKKKK